MSQPNYGDKEYDKTYEEISGFQDSQETVSGEEPSYTVPKSNPKPWLFTPPSRSQSQILSQQSSQTQEESEEILDTIKHAIPQSQKREEPVTREILGTIFAHGVKYINKNIMSLHDLNTYIDDLKTKHWYPFVTKNYFFTTAVFGNPCLFNTDPYHMFSRIQQTININAAINNIFDQKGFEGDRSNFTKAVSKSYTSYNEVNLPNNMNIGKSIREMTRQFEKKNPNSFISKLVAIPNIPRISYLPNIWEFSGLDVDTLYSNYNFSNYTGIRNSTIVIIQKEKKRHFIFHICLIWQKKHI
jgi:hypothetical protein